MLFLQIVSCGTVNNRHPDNGMRYKEICLQFICTMYKEANNPAVVFNFLWLFCFCSFWKANDTVFVRPVNRNLLLQLTTSDTIYIMLIRANHYHLQKEKNINQKEKTNFSFSSFSSFSLLFDQVLDQMLASEFHPSPVPH